MGRAAPGRADPLTRLDRQGDRPRTPGRVGTQGAVRGTDGRRHVDYSTLIGYGEWSELAPPVAAAVAPHLAGDRFGAWVDQPQTRRSGSQYHQALSAWWAGPVVVVELTATRVLKSLGEHRFQPDGPWIGEAVVRHLAPSPVAAKAWTRRATSTGAEGPVAKSRPVHDSLEVLPAPLRRLTAGGPPARSFLWTAGDGQVTEEVMAYRLLEGRAVVMAAWRGPCHHNHLDAQTWHSRVVDTLVTSSRRHGFETDASATAHGPGEESLPRRSRLTGTRRALPPI